MQQVKIFQNREASTVEYQMNKFFEEGDYFQILSKEINFMLDTRGYLVTTAIIWYTKEKK